MAMILFNFWSSNFMMKANSGCELHWIERYLGTGETRWRSVSVRVSGTVGTWAGELVGKTRHGDGWHCHQGDAVWGGGR